MALNPKFRPFGPMDSRAAKDTAHEEFSQWCKDQAHSPTALRNWLADRNINVDWKTANRWWHGHTLPGTDRLIEFAVAELGEAIRIIFGPALVIGDEELRLKALAEKRARIERDQHAIKHLEEIGKRPRVLFSWPFRRRGVVHEVDGPSPG